MTLNRSALLAAAVLFATPLIGHAQVVINELVWDDGGTDDREFVELFNSGLAPVDISGWFVGGRDSTSTNSIATIPGALLSGTTVMAPGAYYVLANTGTLNVNQVVASGFLENDTETVEIRTGASFAAGTLVDAVYYESSAPFSVPADVLAQTAAGYWTNHAGTDLAGTPLNVRTSVARYVSGRDTNNNGNDFGIRQSTPGTANSTSTMIKYSAPNVDALAEGDPVGGLYGSFVGARAFTPGTVTAGLNLNAITAPIPGGATKAIVAWDSSGGGNAVISDSVFNGNGSGLEMNVYLDTNNLPLSVNASSVTFRGSELTFFGVGTMDNSASLADVSGTVGIGNGNSVNGATGVAWYYEKVGETATGNGIVSEKLYLIDAGDGGNQNAAAGNTTADEWLVLATIDLSDDASAWHSISIDISSLGVGVATFDDQTFNFVTQAGLYGELYVGYRENTQAGAVGVPSYVRPATFAPYSYVPEPTSLAALALGGIVLRRRK